MKYLIFFLIVTFISAKVMQRDDRDRYSGNDLAPLPLYCLGGSWIGFIATVTFITVETLF